VLTITEGASTALLLRIHAYVGGVDRLPPFARIGGLSLSVVQALEVDDSVVE
jgi:hypothetical protein